MAHLLAVLLCAALLVVPATAAAVVPTTLLPDVDDAVTAALAYAALLEAYTATEVGTGLTFLDSTGPVTLAGFLAAQEDRYTDTAQLTPSAAVFQDVPDLAAAAPEAKAFVAAVFDVYADLRNAVLASEPWAADVNTAGLVTARDRAVVALLDTISTTNLEPDDLGFAYAKCGVIAIDLRRVDNVWSCYYPVIIDAGGADEYRGQGGTSGPDAPASIVIDLSGSDRYVAGTETRGVNGGGFFGVGILIDAGLTDDTYTATAARGAANGGGYAGAGALIDFGGDDTYTATLSTAAVNGGGYSSGAGLLMDFAGNDTHVATVTQGAALGGGHGGIGVLVDAAGHNTFTGVAPAIAGGAVGEFGARDPVIIPLPQKAVPQARVAAGGLGVMLLGPGDDVVDVRGTGVGGGDQGGFGLLIDTGGVNAYAGAGGFTVGAGAREGVGVLIDAGAATHFTLAADGVGFGTGVQGLGAVVRTEPRGTTTFTAHAGATPFYGIGGGLGVIAAPGPTTFQGASPFDDCTRSAVVSERSGAVVTARVCENDADTHPEPVLDPSTGEPIPPLAKPPVCRDDDSQACGVIRRSLGPSAGRWLASPTVGVDTSGGSSIVAAGSPDGAPVVVVTSYINSADDACDLACRRVVSAVT